MRTTTAASIGPNAPTPRSSFRILDTNHDGVIDPFEMQAYENQVVPEILGAFRVPEGGDGATGGGPDQLNRHRDRPRQGLFGMGPRPPDDPDAVSVANGAAPTR